MFRGKRKDHSRKEETRSKEKAKRSLIRVLVNTMGLGGLREHVGIFTSTVTTEAVPVLETFNFAPLQVASQLYKQPRLQIFFFHSTLSCLKMFPWLYQ